MKKCIVIGITDSRKQWFPPCVMEVIASGRVFSGGKRHHEIVRDLLPDDTEWIDITVPLCDVFARYIDKEEIVVFASGDPLFYGFANTIQREFPDVELTVHPSFNSLQMLAHRMNLPYHDMRMVSQTGRPWLPLDEVLINGEKLIGVLTDRNRTPQIIAQRMLEYGYDNYEVTVGECLGNEDDEKLCVYKGLKSLAEEPRTFKIPNCMILQQTYIKQRHFGIPESDFHLLNGRAKMITKMPIRLLSLSMLELSNKRTFWDVGFCTGSVSIEAKLQFPHLDITSFEVREEGRELMLLNSRKFGTPGITSVIGDFLSLDITPYPKPDAVFIGGHGGKLKEMIRKIHSVLNSDGVIVFNSVSEESKLLFEEGIAEVGMSIVQQTRIAIDEHNPIYILKAQ